MGGSFLLFFHVTAFVALVKCHQETEIRLTSLGAHLTFNCTDDPETVHVKHWVIPPHLVLAYEGYREDNVMVHNDSNSVHIHGIRREQLGDYICYFHRHNETKNEYFKVRIWLYEPTVWVVYERNFLLGGVLAAGFFVIAVSLCCIDAFRWRPEPTLQITRPSSLYNMQHTEAYANGGYESGKRLPRCDYLVTDEYDEQPRQGNGERIPPPRDIGVTAM